MTVWIHGGPQPTKRTAPSVKERDDLEDCPFCGGPGYEKIVHTPHAHGWVGCPECGVYIQWTYSPDDAVRRWNRRVANG